MINNLDDFGAVRQPWNELVATTDVDHAFMKHEWFTEWVGAFGAGAAMAVVTIWRDGLLQAVAPLYRRGLRFRRMRADGLCFLSSAISPRCHFIAADRDALFELLQAVLQLKGWDVLWLENMEEEIQTTSAMLEFFHDHRYGYPFYLEKGRQSPYLLVRGLWEEYWQSLPRKRQEYLEYYCRKRLAKAKSWEVFTIDEPGDFESFSEKMFDISAKSWKGQAGTHLRPDTPEGKVYLGFTRIGLPRGWVKIYVMRIDGQEIGFNYFLTLNGRYSLIRTDYDEAFKYYSPGNTLTLTILRQIYDSGHIGEFDMGGDPDPYKLEWCDRLRSHLNLLVGNRTWRGRFVLYTKNTLLPTWQKVAKRFRHGKSPKK